MTFKASAHEVTFADQTVPNVGTGNLEPMVFELRGVKRFTFAPSVLNIGNTVTGVSFSFEGGFAESAIGGFTVPFAGVADGATIAGANIALATPNNSFGFGQVFIENPPPYIRVQPYFTAWPSSFNGSLLRVSACWR